MNGAAVFLAAFLVFGIYQGVTAESYIDADEIYYAYYMKHISGPWSEESRDGYEISVTSLFPCWRHRSVSTAAN